MSKIALSRCCRSGEYLQCANKAVWQPYSRIAVAELFKYYTTVATERSILHRMRKENPEKAFYPLEPSVLCPNMKRITLEDVLNSLRDMSPAVELDKEVLRRARAPIDRMLEVR